MSPPPPQADTLQVVRISSLAAALAKLDIQIPIEELLEAIHQEDEAARLKSTGEATKRRTALSSRKLTFPSLSPAL